MRREHRQYTPITCIIGSGTQYIDTGYKFTNNANKHQFILKYAKTGSTTNNSTHMCGSCNSYDSLWFNGYTDSNNSYSTQWYIGGTGQIRWLADYDLAIHVLDFTLQNNTTILKFDNSSTTPNYSATIVSNSNIFLYCSSKGGVPFLAKKAYMKLYYCKIYESDVLVRDFIPVLDYNKVPCLYDKINKAFHYNLGTGTFSYEL